MTELVKGAGGGGGKSGGGSGVTPSEQPDTLRSRQYARVLDLVSEGEIEGLVNGLQSVFLDDTPVQNSDGSTNFKGLTIASRSGTQAQDFIPGFSASESETAVVTKVTAATPVVRSISNAEVDAARVTISVPSLSSYDIDSAVLGGTSVSLKVEVQANGGGFVPAKLRAVDAALLTVSSTQAKSSGVTTSANVSIGWTGATGVVAVQTCAWRIEYRAVGAGSWTTLKSGTFSGSQMQKVVVSNPGTIFETSTTTLVPPSAAATASISGMSEDTYEFRVVRVSGTGTLALSGSSRTWTGTDVISGKSTSKYQRSYRIPLEGSAPWDIRITRLTADSASSNLRNETWWDSYTEIVEAKLSYPNSALFAISVDAEQFRSIPVRGYEIRGLKVRVPSNYDPILRTYSGTWDGTFTVAWTDNPAWCFYDMLTADRYGLGNYIDASQVDKWTLYAIAQYCDETVDNGLGGSEPRFTCNLYLQQQDEAFNVLVAMASIFRAMVYWADGSITASQDAPSSPVALFSPANVVDGAFNYSGSSIKQRHTVALVSWNDPDDRYRQKIEYVEDREGIALYGVQQTQIVAFGCSSRGQAHRLGRWMLYSERLETETVSFRCGMDAINVAPGEIIQTTDPVRAGVRLGGRILSATASSVTLDASVTLSGGSTYTLWAALPDDSIESRAVTTGAGSASVLSVSPPFSAAPQEMAMWVLASNTVEPETWRVISISEADATTAEVTALAYDARKYAAVESDLNLEPKASSIISSRPPAPSDIVVTETLVQLSPAIVGANVNISWTGFGARYEVSYRVDGGNAIILSTVSPSIDIHPAASGAYDIEVVAINAAGVRSPSASVQQQVYGLAAVPADVQNLQMAAIAGMAFLSFDPASDLDVLVSGGMRVRHSSALSGASWNNAVDIGTSIPGAATTATLPLLSGTYMAKWVDSSGNESANAVSVTTTAPDILAMNVVQNLVEHPGWTGTKSGVVYDAVLGGIKLDSLATIDGMAGTVDTWGLIDSLGGIASTGEYTSATTIDLGSVVTSRLTASMLSQGYDADDRIDARTDPIDTWLSVDGTNVSDVLVALYVRTTSDDPAGAPSWSAWQPFFVGDWTARGFQFKAVLQSGSATHNVVLKEMALTVDMPDLLDSQNGIASGAATKSVVYTVAFKAVQALAITAENMATGDYYTIANKTTAGFDITFKNAGGTNVSRTFDYIARGY